MPPMIPATELERAWVAAALSVPKLPEHLRRQVAALLGWDAFLAIGGTIGAIAGAHLINPVLGVAVDVVVAGVAVTWLGADAVEVAREFISFWEVARLAQTPQQLDRAATLFANAATRVGVNGVLLLVASGTAPRAAMVGAEARWSRLVGALRLTTKPGSGALWSRIGPERAKLMAASRGRITLEMTDGFAVFKPIYDREFGARQDAVTSAVWETLSRRFAQSLDGTVEVYTDLSQLNRGVQNAQLAARFARPPAFTSVPHPKPEDLRLLPQVTAELDEISDLMLRNDRISAVTVFDVSSGIARVERAMTRTDVLRAAGG